MIIRAIRLREAIDLFCAEYAPAASLELSPIEWKQLGYLIDIIRPFNFFTTTVGKTKSVTLPYTLQIYDELFERLTESRRRLTAKQSGQPWVKILIHGINTAEQKLDQYYNLTYTNLGSIYGIGALLNPLSKSSSFNPDYCWLDHSVKDWEEEFVDHFRNLYSEQYAKETGRSGRLQALRDSNRDPLALMLDRSRITRESIPVDLAEDRDNFHEVDQWLSMRKFLY